MNQVDWEDIRHFTVLSDCLNLARAAASLGTSQVTVMRRVKALEQSLGTTLFLRRRDGHRLTPAGVDLRRSTDEAAQLIADGASRVAARDRALTGRVRIATTEIAATWILGPALAAFVAANPEILLEIDASPDRLALVDDTETIALRFQRPERGAFRIRKLGTMTFSLYRRRRALRHPPTDDAYIGWVGTFEEIGLARWLRRAYGGAPPLLGLTTFAGHLDAVHRGIATAALPDFIGSSDPALVKVDVAEPPFSLEAWLVVPEQVAKLARVRKVARFVEDALRKSIGSMTS